jgi:hypothetical protein
METLIDVQHAFHLLCPDREELIKRLRKRAFCSRFLLTGGAKP